MADIKRYWDGSSATAKTGLVLGALLIVAATAGLGRWALDKHYQPLFTGLSEQDASTMVAELDRMKVPYRLEAGGTQILVPQEQVHKTRLQLVGKNLPLHGAVGFEIFNNTDFGMTEFTQKVNYQRALQGELTRTIMSLDEVQAARVHLSLPESTLFKREQGRPKASVTLALKPGRGIARDQVNGIQRLVAAAVPGIEAGDVTVLDQKGVALSRGAPDGADAGSGGDWQLETKRQIEDHLARKVSAVLDRSFGPGQGIVSVDVQLNFDHVKVTTEEVLAGKGVEGAPAGVLVRERQTLRDAPTRARDKAEPAAAEATVTNTESEYQTGRRVEQIVGTPGSVRRINVGVVVPRGVSPDRLDRIRQIVAMSAGIDAQRGDGVAVYSLDQMADGAAALKPTAAVEATEAAPAALASGAAPAQDTRQPDAFLPTVLAGLLAIVVAIALLLAWRRRAARGAVPPAEPRLLAEAQRQALLLNMQRWLEAPAPAPVRERESLE